MRKTKIVCTLGPSTDDLNTLGLMIQSGMDVARINLSHGNWDQHQVRIETVQRASRAADKFVGIMLDTRGPEIRVGELERGVAELRSGAKVELVPTSQLGNDEVIPINYEGILGDVKEGTLLLLDDGNISLIAEKVGEAGVLCSVLSGGILKARKKVSIPGVRVSLPCLTEEDVADVAKGVRLGVDFIAQSFVREAADVKQLKQLIEVEGGRVSVIAKIETKEAVSNLEDILNVADGLLVARGDLGVEIPPEEVPILQKEIISRANSLGKPVITATQMLESMIYNSRPTRAEASDVANAILDGTDAVMLSAETASGKYPVESVRMMARIAYQAEKAISYEENLRRRSFDSLKSVTNAVSLATCSAAHNLGAAAIITATQSGYTARMVARYRPRPPVIAACPVDEVLRQLTMVWGVVPLKVAKTTNTDDTISEAVSAAVAHGLIKEGDLVIITAGIPVGVPGTTNMMKVHVVGGELR